MLGRFVLAALVAHGAAFSPGARAALHASRMMPYTAAASPRMLVTQKGPSKAELQKQLAGARALVEGERVKVAALEADATRPRQKRNKALRAQLDAERATLATLEASAAAIEAQLATRAKKPSLPAFSPPKLPALAPPALGGARAAPAAANGALVGNALGVALGAALALVAVRVSGEASKAERAFQERKKAREAASRLNPLAPLGVTAITSGVALGAGTGFALLLAKLGGA
ncbi:hypothetical protein KFE25_005652 [Diacronema lutheri]|uniref:Uncharacterized protein n=1 Tax=Diacronema lutheri TaxID=2081491 RepID=A0A8J5XPW3_DIALT|nr:hypothetical protein KFE25_005652 [Diacronema lutheri]